MDGTGTKIAACCVLLPAALGNTHGIESENMYYPKRTENYGWSISTLNKIGNCECRLFEDPDWLVKVSHADVVEMDRADLPNYDPPSLSPERDRLAAHIVRKSQSHNSGQRSNSTKVRQYLRLVSSDMVGPTILIARRSEPRT